MLLHMQDSKEYSSDMKRTYYYRKYQYDDIDSYSGETLKELFNQIDEYSEIASSDNFKLLVDIYKENYKSLNNNDHFV